MNFEVTDVNNGAEAGEVTIFKPHGCDIVCESGADVLDAKNSATDTALSEFAFPVVRNDRLERALS